MNREQSPAKQPLILELHDEHTHAVKELEERELALVSGGIDSQPTIIWLPDVTVTSRESAND